ncbi:hypothetical protein [Fictibacillus sp. NRS-1165]|uniref:hypothetical protein n=1 Tax=Fictibacillus sp. NRS-1165 TaxID=3144463 RepID=UPI003D25218E
MTTFEEVAALDSGVIQRLIDRADSWIRRATGRVFTEDADEYIRQDIQVASLMLVEYLWYWDNPEIRETTMGPYDGERLGSYSVGYKNLNQMEQAMPGEETGIKELDQILKSYRYKPSIGNIFRVSGPSRDEV